MIDDMRGRIGELLAKAIDQHALDAAMPKGELEQFRQFLGAYGQLERRRQGMGRNAAAGLSAAGRAAIAPRAEAAACR